MIDASKPATTTALIVMFLALVTGFSYGQYSRLPSRKKAVDRFLIAWLVKKDIPSALRSFDRKALSKGDVFRCGCCEQYIDEDERDEKVISKQLAGFLGDIAKEVKRKSLRSILLLRDYRKASEFEISELIAKMRRSGFLNSPARDRYYVSRVRALMSKEDYKDDDWLLLRNRYNLKGAFFSIVQVHGFNDGQKPTNPHYDEPYLYALWVRSGNTWRIAMIGAGPCV